MKLHLPLPLRSALCSALVLLAAGSASATGTTENSYATDTWGNTVSIGDSITHGFNARSYRWFLFKTLVDNGIVNTELGIQNGYVQSSVTTDAGYGFVAGSDGEINSFDNLHAAQSGITASQVAGGSYTNNGMFSGTGLSTWLTEGSATQMHTQDGSFAVPDTAIVMLGTNDIFGLNSESLALHTGEVTLSDGTVTTSVAWHTQNQIDYLNSIVASLQEANAEVNIVVTAVPTWSENRSGSNSSADSAAALTQLNAAIREWAENKDGVTFVDINEGIINVANTSKPGTAVASMYNSDCQHPNEYGNLIIAGNIAQQLGIAGRTAGQERRAGSSFTYQAEGLLSAATTASGVTLTENGGLLMENAASFSASWSASDDLSNGFTVDFSLADGLGNGAEGGWESSQMFTLSIGDGSHSGVLTVNEAYIMWGNTILYSMDTSGLTDSLRVAYVYGNEAANLSKGFYIWKGDMLIGEALPGSGSSDVIILTNNSGGQLTLSTLSMTGGAYAPEAIGYSASNPIIPASTEVTYVEVGLTAPNLGNGSNAIVAQARENNNQNLDISVNGGTLTNNWLVVSQGAHAGNILVELDGAVTKNRANTYNVVQYTGALTGSIDFTIADTMTMTEESTQATWETFLGAENATVDGNLSMSFLSSDFTINHTNNTRPAAVAGLYGSSVTGTLSILLGDGSFTGNIYGGAISGADSTIGKGTQVTVKGGASVSGNISAGGTAGIINGGTTLTISEVQADSDFASYSGTLSGSSTGGTVNGTRTLCFDKVQLDSFGATLTNFDAMQVTGNSSIGLSSLGGATEVSVEAGSRLTLTAGTHEASFFNSGTVAVGADAALSIYGADGNQTGRYEVNGGALSIRDYAKLDSHIALSSGSLSNADTVLAGKVSIAATGNVTLSGVATSDISSLQTLTEGVTVTGLSGNLVLDEASLTLGSSNQTTEGAALQFSDGGLSVGTLTLNLSSDYASNLNGQLLVNQGTLSAGQVNLNLAGYRLDYLGTETQNGYSYVNYKSYTIANKENINLGNGSNAIVTQARANSNQSLDIHVNGGTLTNNWLVVSQGAHVGDVLVELDGAVTKNRANTYNVVQYTGALTGSIDFTIADTMTMTEESTHKTWETFLGAENATVDGNLSMSFLSSDFTINHTNSTRSAAVAGLYGSSVTGTLSILLGDGSFTGNIYGGAINGADSTIDKGTQVTVKGGASVSGNISAGGTTGIINGGTTLTVKEVMEGSDFASYSGTLSGSSTGGTVNGTRTLCFDNVVLSAFNARLENFDEVRVTGNSNLSLANVGTGTSKLSIDEGSRLALTGGDLNLNELVLSLGAEGQINEEASLLFGNASLSVTTLTLNLSDALVSLITTPAATFGLTEASPLTEDIIIPGSLLLTEGNLQAEKIAVTLPDDYGNYQITDTELRFEEGKSYLDFNVVQRAVPEPTTATLSLLALAALAARRRRR